MKATLVSRSSALGLGVVVALLSPTGFFSAGFIDAGYLLASRPANRMRGTIANFDRSSLLGAAKQGLPLTLSLTCCDLQRDRRFMIANLVGAADPENMSRPRSGSANAHDAGNQRAPRFPARRANSRNQGPARRDRILANAWNCCSASPCPPAWVFAVISSHVANVVLGVDFRALAAETMRSWPSP